VYGGRLMQIIGLVTFFTGDDDNLSLTSVFFQSTNNEGKKNFLVFSIDHCVRFLNFDVNFQIVVTFEVKGHLVKIIFYRNKDWFCTLAKFFSREHAPQRHYRDHLGRQHE
jgi:hypothetical protein